MIQRVVDVAFDEGRPVRQSQFGGKNRRGSDGLARETHAGHACAALRQRQGVSPKVALEMQNPLAVERADQFRKFKLLQRIEAAVSRAQAGQVNTSGREMNPHTLVPVLAV